MKVLVCLAALLNLLQLTTAYLYIGGENTTGTDAVPSCGVDLGQLSEPSCCQDATNSGTCCIEDGRCYCAESASSECLYLEANEECCASEITLRDSSYPTGGWSYGCCIPEYIYYPTDYEREDLCVRMNAVAPYSSEITEFLPQYFDDNDLPGDCMCLSSVTECFPSTTTTTTTTTTPPTTTTTPEPTTTTPAPTTTTTTTPPTTTTTPEPTTTTPAPTTTTPAPTTSTSTTTAAPTTISATECCSSCPDNGIVSFGLDVDQVCHGVLTYDTTTSTTVILIPTGCAAFLTQLDEWNSAYPDTYDYDTIAYYNGVPYNLLPISYTESSQLTSIPAPAGMVSDCPGACVYDDDTMFGDIDRSSCYYLSYTDHYNNDSVLDSATLIKKPITQYSSCQGSPVTLAQCMLENLSTGETADPDATCFVGTTPACWADSGSPVYCELVTGETVLYGVLELTANPPADFVGTEYGDECLETTDIYILPAY